MTAYLVDPGIQHFEQWRVATSAVIPVDIDYLPRFKLACRLHRQPALTSLSGNRLRMRCYRRIVLVQVRLHSLTRFARPDVASRPGVLGKWQVDIVLFLPLALVHLGKVFAKLGQLGRIRQQTQRARKIQTCLLVTGTAQNQVIPLQVQDLTDNKMPCRHLDRDRPVNVLCRRKCGEKCPGVIQTVIGYGTKFSDIQ